MELVCPICGGALTRREREFACENRHSFDIARQGYVNLLTVQQKKSLHPGDTREQVLSRRAFLDAGFYAPIARTLCDRGGAGRPGAGAGRGLRRGILLHPTGGCSGRGADRAGHFQGGRPLRRRKIQKRPVALRHRRPSSGGRRGSRGCDQPVCPDRRRGIPPGTAPGRAVFSGAGRAGSSAWTEVHHLSRTEIQGKGHRPGAARFFAGAVCPDPVFLYRGG